jgi:hypothetical protein
MGLINMPTSGPRRYHHPYIYVDERKEKLKKIEDRAKRELGMLPQDSFDAQEFRGTFVKATTHLRRRKESGKKPLKAGIIILLIIGLILLWHFLLHAQI